MSGDPAGKGDSTAKGANEAKGKVVATYVYCDEDGKPLHYKDRIEPGRNGKKKEFIQYRKLSNGDKVWSFAAGWYEPGKGSKNWVRAADGSREDDPPSSRAEWFPECRTVLFMLPELIKGIQAGLPVWLFEGEKDAKRAAADGVLATTSVYGAGAVGARDKWHESYSEVLAEACELNQVLDNDLAGWKHGLMLVEICQKWRIKLRLWVCPPECGKDYSDLRDAGKSLADLIEVDVAWVERQIELASPSASSSGGGVSAGAPPAKEPAGGDGFPQTDLGNAMRLIDRYGEDLRHCPQTGQWLVWDGSVWKPDESKGAPLLARWQKVLPLIKDTSWRKKCQSASAIANMASLAKVLEGVPIMDYELNRVPHLFPVANGVIDLRSGKMVEDSKGAMFTMRSPVVFQEGAQCPKWVKEIKRAFPDALDDEMVEYMQKLCGYCLTGETSQKELYFLYGDGDTGKSQFVNVLTSILGDFAGTVSPDKLMRKRNDDEIPTHWAVLRHSRMVSVSEIKAGDVLDEGLVKRLTGGDVIMARMMRENAFHFRPVWKLLLTGNHQPAIMSQDSGIWTRVRMIPYNQEVPKADRIKDFWLQLMLESSGILNWMIEGAVKWYRDGMETPEEVKVTTREYRDEQDTVGNFLKTKCRFGDYQIGAAELYKSFREFQGERGEMKWQMRGFSTAMQEQIGRLARLARDAGKAPPVEKVRGGSNGSRVYRGLTTWEALGFAAGYAPSDQTEESV